MFETADDQFEQIRNQRQEEYLNEIRFSTSSNDEFLAHEANSDSLKEYLAWRFPNQPLEAVDGQFIFLKEVINFEKYKTLNVIEEIVNKTTQMRNTIYEKANVVKIDEKIPSTTELITALCLVDSDLRNTIMFHDENRIIFEEVIRASKLKDQ